MLHDHQIALSRRFGGPPTAEVAPRFREIAGTAVVEEALVVLARALENAIPAGDHSIFIGRVLAAVTAPGEPLVHFDRYYRRLAPLD